MRPFDKIRTKLREIKPHTWTYIVVGILFFAIVGFAIIVGGGKDSTKSTATTPTTSEGPQPSRTATPGGSGGGGATSGGSDSITTTTQSGNTQTTTTTTTSSTTTTTTTDPDNQPPNAPNSPSPAHDYDSADYDSLLLSWQGSDPDGDEVTYYVDYGTSNPPTGEACAWQAATSCTVTSLQPDTTYYWKVTAKDEHGAEAEGPVWSFTTRETDPPQGPDVCPEPLICPPELGPS